METELLIDGDLFAFSTAIALQEEHPFVEGEISFNERIAKKVLDERLTYLKKRFNAKKMTVALSCQRNENFRFTQVCDTYKQHRKKKAPPIGLPILREYIIKNYNTITEQKLEADDLIGYMATDPNRGTKRIVVSWDKDVTAIEGMSYNPRTDDYRKVSKIVSLKFFLYQVLTGDTADGYKGLKKIGPKKAKGFIYNIKPMSIAWDMLTDLAIKQGHDEAYLLQQARLAWILRFDDYDFESKEIRLWTPKRINDYI